MKNIREKHLDSLEKCFDFLCRCHIFWSSALYVPRVLLLHILGNEPADLNVTKACSIMQWSVPVVGSRVLVLHIVNDQLADVSETPSCSVV